MELIDGKGKEKNIEKTISFMIVPVPRKNFFESGYAKVEVKQRAIRVPKKV